MAKGSNLLLRVLISLLYILWGGDGCIAIFATILDGGFSAGLLPTLGLSLMMLFAGVFGLFRLKAIVRHILGIAILVLAVITLVSTFPANLVSSLIPVILGIIYVIYV